VDLKTVLEDCLDFGMVTSLEARLTCLGVDNLLYSSVLPFQEESYRIRIIIYILLYIQTFAA